jgi:hypothetical protein
MKKKIMTYNEAKAYLKPLGLKSKEDYDEWWNTNKPDFLPQFPEEYYGRKPHELCQNSNKKTIEEVLAEIKKTIDVGLSQETMLSRLRNKGFEVEHCWAKNGSIGDIYYMKRKNVYRIQVCESVFHGNYQKAYCVIIGCDDVSETIQDSTVIRNMKKR